MRLITWLQWKKLLYLLGVLLAILQIYHMFLLNRLEAQNLQMEQNQSAKLLEQAHRLINPKIRDAINSSPVMDSSGEYKIVYNIFKANYGTENTRPYEEFAVTLVTHCSINHAHHLQSLSEAWQGPISLAVFVPNVNSLVIDSLVILHRCLHGNTNITIHLVYPLTSTAMHQISTDYWSPSQLNECGNLEQALKATISQGYRKNYDLYNLKYPNNLLRNVARRHAQTPYVMTTDIDMIPSENLYSDFVDFARRSSFTSFSGTGEKQKIAYVLPAFEIQSNTPVPRNKNALVSLWDQGYLQPFYQVLCEKCQRQTNYTSWRKNRYMEHLSVAYTVKWVDPWEPFYIAPKGFMPFYDERFKQYGFNRISQACEMHIAGFQFDVFDNAFLVHLGFKSIEGFHHTKDVEQEENRILFRKFKEELKVKYPESQLRC